MPSKNNDIGEMFSVSLCVFVLMSSVDGIVGIDRPRIYHMRDADGAKEGHFKGGGGGSFKCYFLKGFFLH